MAEFFPVIGSHDALVRAGAHSSVAVHRAQAGGEVDAGALRNERWPGRNLPLHAERHHRTSLSRVFGGRSPGDPSARRIRKTRHRGRTHFPHATLHVARVGHGIRNVCAR